MEKQLRYVLTLTLEEMALRKIAVVLWNQPDVLSLIGSLVNFPHELKWKTTVQVTVAVKLLNLHLPYLITEKMMNRIKHIGLQILRWKFFHESFLCDSGEVLDVCVLENLRWTTSGSVDYRKTAETLIRSDSVNIVKRYKLACLYCVKGNIRKLWEKLSDENKAYFYSGRHSSPSGNKFLWKLWPYILKGKECQLDYESIFECSAIRGNRAAAEYFLQKLPSEERETSVIEAIRSLVADGCIQKINYPYEFPKENSASVLYYLFSLLPFEQQIQIFKENPCKFLNCFLLWPWQDLFLEYADIMWKLLTESGDVSFSWEKDIQIQTSDFPQLFQDFFVRMPNLFKNQFVDRECQTGFFFRKFFNSDDVETIKVILRNVDPSDRVRLLTSKFTFNLYYKFICGGRLDVLETGLRGAGLSKEDIQKLKERFVVFMRKKISGKIEWENPKWRGFFEIFNKIYQTAEDR